MLERINCAICMYCEQCCVGIQTRCWCFVCHCQLLNTKHLNPVKTGCWKQLGLSGRHIQITFRSKCYSHFIEPKQSRIFRIRLNLIAITAADSGAGACTCGGVACWRYERREMIEERWRNGITEKSEESGRKTHYAGHKLFSFDLKMMTIIIIMVMTIILVRD